MAIVFNGSNQYLSANSKPVDSLPFTMACWFNRDDGAGNEQLMGYFNTSNTRQPYALSTLGSPTYSQYVNCNSQNSSGNGGNATTTNSFTPGEWSHACGIWAATNDRKAYLNGDTANKGSDTTSITAASSTNFTIGVIRRSSLANYLNGKVFWPALWDVALTEAEVVSLAAGLHPTLVRPSALKFFAPMGGLDGNYSRSYIWDTNLTEYNSPTWDDDSPTGLIYPRRTIIQVGGSGGGGGDPVVERQLSPSFALFV